MLLKILLLSICAVISLVHVYGAAHDGKGSKTGSSDCSGVIAVCSTGCHSTHNTGLIRFHTTIYEKGAGWNKELGTYTVACPGVYHVSFAGKDGKNNKIILKKRPVTSKTEWTILASTPPGGGFNSVIVELAQGEQISVFASKFATVEAESSAHVTTFSLFKINTK